MTQDPQYISGILLLFWSWGQGPVELGNKAFLTIKLGKTLYSRLLWIKKHIRNKQYKAGKYLKLLLLLPSIKTHENLHKNANWKPVFIRIFMQIFMHL